MPDRPPSITIDVEHLLSHLLRKDSTHGLVGGDETTWFMSRRFDALSGTCVATSAATRMRLWNIWIKMMGCIDRMEKSLNNPSTKEPELVAAAVELSLLLMGRGPDHWNRRLVSHSKHFRLDRYRSHTYSQTPEERAAFLYDRGTKYWAATVSDEEKREIASRFAAASTRDAYIKFCRWVAEAHPDEYKEWTRS